MILDRSEEFWKDIEDYEGYYQVSDLGNVKSIRRNKILKPSNQGQGYLQVVLCKSGKNKHCRVHRLVAQAFIDNPYNLSDVNHRNENKSDNNVNNLEWITNKDNNNYGTRNERLSIPIVQLNKEGSLITKWKSGMEVEREKGISRANISKCCKGQSQTSGGFKWMFEKDYYELIRRKN